MEQADKKRAWKQYVAYNVKAKNEGRKSAEYSENSPQKANKMGERIQATPKGFDRIFSKETSRDTGKTVHCSEASGSPRKELAR